jgi:hypothetical protein
LADNRLTWAAASAVLAAVALALASCGRNGSPLPPPGPVAATPPPAAASSPGAAPAAQPSAQKNGFDMFGNPVAPPGQKKSFLLDPLLQ